MRQIQPGELRQRLDDTSQPAPVLLDVREPWEFEICRLEGATLIPMNTVPARCDELDADAEIVVICHHGMRSMQVARFLEQRGFSNVVNLDGGVARWASEVDPAMAQY